MARVDVHSAKGSFRTPIVLASGPAGFGCDLARALDFRRIGALTTKTITHEPREGNPQPRIVDAPCGALNSIGLENPGVARFRSEVMPKIRALPTARIVSIAGRSADEVGKVAGALEGEPGVDWLELNLSCPNVRGETVADRPDAVSEYVRAVRAASSRPLLAKLSAGGGLVALADAALRAGADGLTLVNAVRGLRIDVETGKALLARATGGLCGPAILPIALAAVYEARRAFPEAFLVGTGGVVTARDAVEMLCAGANLVGVGFGVMADPAAVFGLAEGLERWLDARGVADVAEVVGAAHRGGWRVP